MAASPGTEREYLLDCLERARVTAEQLQAELGREQRALARTILECREGAPVSRVLALVGSGSFPESLTDPTARFGEAIHDCRAELIRCLVDEEGWTLSRVAQETGHARQVVSRLYHSRRLAPEHPEP